MKNSPFSWKKAKVLLIKSLPWKGQPWEIIEVKTHYALYVLIPQWIAVIYDKQVQNQKAASMKRIEKAKQEEQAAILSMIEKIESDWGILFEKQATEENKLYDSITSRSLVTYVTKKYWVSLQPSHFSLEKIEEIGEFTASLSYQDIQKEFSIKVSKTSS